MRILRIAFRIFRYALLALIALAIGAVAVFTLTELGRTRLAGLVSDMISGPVQVVRISGVDGIWSGKLIIGQVIVEDDDGPWLALRGVAVDWSPMALLGFAFDAEKVSAERIEVARLPKPAETGSSGSFSLPVTIDITALDLPDIRLSAQLAGSAARISAAGSLTIDNAPLTAKANLAVNRVDGRDGALKADIAFVPGENRLDISINGSEPAGGVIATLLRLPGSPPVEIDVSGKGAATDWRGRAIFLVDGALTASIDGRHQLTDAGSRIEAKGNGDFQAFLPDDIAVLARGTTEFSFAGLVRPWSAISIDTAELNTETLRATARGGIDPEGVSDFQLEAMAAQAPVPLSYGAGDARISAQLRKLSVRAFGPGDALGFTANLDLASVNAAGVAAEDINVVAKSDAFNLIDRSGPVSLIAQSAAVGSVTPTLANLLAGAVSLAGDVLVSASAVEISRLDAKTGTVSAKATGRYGIDDGVLKLDIEGNVLSAALPAVAGKFLDRNVSLSGSIERGAEGALSVSNLKVGSGSLSVDGSASLAEDIVSADISGAIGDLSRLSSAAVGSAAFTLQASGDLARPTLVARLTSDGVTVAGRDVTGLSLDASITANPKAPEGSITLVGQIGSDRLDGAATLASRDGRSDVGDIRLSLGKNKLAGALTLNAALVPEGEISFDFPDISPFAALALVSASGAAEGSVRFSRDGDAPRVVIAGNIPQFAMDAASASGISIAATTENYLQAPVVAGTIRAVQIVSSGADIKDAEIKLTRDGDWTAFDGSATANGTPAEATGRVLAEGGTITLELAKAKATYRKLSAVLSRPTTILMVDGEARFEGLNIAAAGGSAAISGSAGSALNLKAQINALPAKTVDAFVPGIGADGTISGTVEVVGTASNPSVTYDVGWNGGQTAQTRSAGLGAMNVKSQGSYTGSTLRFDATVGDGSGLGMKGGGSVDISARSLDVSFNGRVPFAFLTRRLAAQGVALTGGADVALKIGGGFVSPQIGGTVRTSGARLIHAPTGIAIDDLTASIDLGGGKANITSMAGRLSTGGSITGSGSVGIEPSSGFPADLKLQINDARYTDGRVVTATFDGSLALVGPVTGNPVLSGQINLGRSVITIPENLPASLSTLDVQHRNASAAVEMQQAALNPGDSASGGGGINLDLNINAPREIIVQGRGLDAELGGSLKLTGPASSVSALGQFDLRRGRLSFLGRRLDFTRGTIGFSGSLIPYLNFAADTRAEDASVTVVISGPANNPRFSFESSPILPEDEVLARLLFGKAMSGLSPVQIAQLASAAAQLAGLGGSTSLLQRLRERVGVDDIDVRTDDKTGDTSLSVGKYLNDRTYLSIEKGSQPGSGKAIIDLNVGGGVKLRGEATDGGETSGGIFYEKEY